MERSKPKCATTSFSLKVVLIIETLTSYFADHARWNHVTPPRLGVLVVPEHIHQLGVKPSSLGGNLLQMGNGWKSE